MPNLDERCTDCRAVAPSMGDEQTLRSTSGWRLSFVRAPDGTTQQIWRCPACSEKRSQRPAKPEKT